MVKNAYRNFILLSITILFLTQNTAQPDTQVTTGFKNVSLPNECLEEEFLIAENGTSIIIAFENGCSLFNYTISTGNQSSIIAVTVTASPLTNASETAFNSSGNVVVSLQETGTPHYANTSWIISPNQTFKNSYFSRTSHVTIVFELRGNWSRNEVILNYQEVAFDTVYKNSSENGNMSIKPWIQMEGRSYRPNCVYIFNIMKPENVSSSNVMVTLHDLDIDEKVGEYLLIGAGTHPFEGPPPLFISNANAKKKYLVNEENAYIVFVAGSTRKNHTGFYITWEFTGTEIKIKEIDDNEDVLESVPICIYNITAAQEEFNKTEDLFAEFREKFAEEASNYAKENNLLIGQNINPSSVSIFQISRIVKVNKTSQAFYARVKISRTSEKGKAIFTRQELKRIVEIYTQHYLWTGRDIYQFGKCVARKGPDSWSSLGWYLIIPVFCCVFLLLWTWKKNPISDYFVKKKRRKRASQQEINKKYYQDDCTTATKSAASQNPYASLPKLQVTTDQGRRFTLKLSDRLIDDAEHSDDEIFNKMHFHRRRSDILESGRAKISNMMFSNKQSGINHAFELGEEWDTKSLRSDQTSTQKESKAEHVYDSVKSTSRSCKDDEVSETKL